ncbi:ATP-dependent DNA ligase [Streptoalloteichus hindustanus]|uniref:DNA ligase (ATP) n=1 Tax=Streptoalloteichus hindustanus TaxID=2017 RepID=A0A1M5H6N2_STRHI|nr:ATP-dependent DNA ligase [Streptoalloteichus hindustanus]SHG11392.1 ATP-dependent DNA ligase [Streptoalloteichus hindustanus]
MALALSPPVQPMLATSVGDVPDRPGLVYEPKWDGFRCLVFADGADVVLQSRNGRDLARYFPEVVTAAGDGLPGPAVLDGELVVDRHDRLDWDALSERVHPAASRVRRLAEETPARFVAFDLLALADRSLLDEPFGARRAALADFLPGDADRLHLTPATTDIATAREWFRLFEGAGLDGLVAKPVDGRYTPGRRTLLKIKHMRTADCVVAGLRWHINTEPGTAVGSLLLGLHDEHAVLHHVGVVGAFPAATRRQLATELTPLTEHARPDHPWLEPNRREGQRLPGAVSRWRSTEQEWVPLRPERVIEIAYDHTEGGHPARFRHTTQFVRWRPDRDAASCGYDQLDEPARYDLDAVLRGEVRPS